jgi:hypothetical protein
MTTPARPSPFTQLVSTADWEALFSASGIADGIDGTQSIGQCAPSLDTVGRNAVMGPGNVIIKGQIWSCSASVSTPIPGPSSQNRIDMLVMQYNRGATTAATVIQPVVLTGTPSASPVPPSLTQTPSGLFQIPVSSWSSTSAGAITGLTDLRQWSIDTWHSVAPPSGWGNIAFRCRLIPPNGVWWDIEVSQSGTFGNSFNCGTLPGPAYYPAVTRHFPLTMSGEWYATSGGSYAGDARLYIPGGSGTPQIIVPTVSTSGLCTFYGQFIYPNN